MEPDPEETNLNRDILKSRYGKTLDILELLKKKLREMIEKNLSSIQIQPGWTTTLANLPINIDTWEDELFDIGRRLGLATAEIQKDVDDLNGQIGGSENQLENLREELDEINEKLNEIQNAMRIGISNLTDDELFRFQTQLERLQRRRNEVQAKINELDERLEGDGLFTRDPTVNPPAVRKYLEKKGNDPVFRIKLIRTPLSASTKLLLNVATLGGVKQAMQNANIDELFHLGMVINDDMLLEKNEVISLRQVKSSDYTDKTQTLDVPVTNKNLTYNQLFENTQKKMGNNYGSYNAKTNNCSVFISNVLSANGLDTAESNKFVNQKTEELFQSFPSLSEKLVNLATSLGASVDRLLKGEGQSGGSVNDFIEMFYSYGFDLDPNIDDQDYPIMLRNLRRALYRSINTLDDAYQSGTLTEEQLIENDETRTEMIEDAQKITRELDTLDTISGQGQVGGCHCNQKTSTMYGAGSFGYAPSARAKF